MKQLLPDCVEHYISLLVYKSEEGNERIGIPLKQF